MIVTGNTTVTPSMKKAFLQAVSAALLSLFLAAAVLGAANASSRIKDIVQFEGVRENMLVGYGLVVGLNGTGDTLVDGQFTKQSLKAMLNRLGVKPTDAGLDSKNVAAVMVTAVLPPFARQGSRIDVTVSALGDAKSLLGGTLLVTPVLGADGEVYAVAQGQLAVGGFAASGAAETIVKGENVRISTIAIAQGNLIIRITETEQVSQPGPFANVGATTTVPRTEIEVTEGEERRLGVVNAGVTIQELVNGLNSLGIGPRDMITILQAVKAAGALQAEIVVM